MAKFYLNKIVIMILLQFVFSYPVSAQNISFEQHTIDQNFPGISYVKVIDLDADGDLDIIGGSEITPYSASRGIAWWRNDGDSWTRFTVDASFIHVMSVDAAYVDGDNNLDIIATSWELHQTAWWKNSGNPESGWTKHVVKNNYYNAHDAKGVDIDLDGDTDIVTCNSNPGSVDILYNQNAAQPSWNNVQIASPFSSAKSITIIDLDFDNDLDIVAGADGANDIAWWENTGSNSQVWNKTTIENNLQGAAYTSIIDMNNDSKLDIIGSGWSSNTIAYYICNDLATNNWTKSIVTTTLGIASKGTGCDFDMDGDIDIVALGKDPGELVLFVNDNFVFTEQVLYPNFTGGAAIAVADLDQDGDQDIIAGAGILGDLLWYENKNITPVEENEELPLSFELKQNYPNPFNPATIIQFTIPSAGKYSMKIFNILGQEVAVLFNREFKPGPHNVNFNAAELASGIYLYQLTGDNVNLTRKMILLR